MVHICSLAAEEAEGRESQAYDQTRLQSVTVDELVRTCLKTANREPGLPLSGRVFCKYFVGNACIVFIRKILFLGSVFGLDIRVTVAA